MNLNRGRSKGGPSFVVIIIIFNIYTAQINIQEDVIKCALHVKLQASFFLKKTTYNIQVAKTGEYPLFNTV